MGKVIAVVNQKGGVGKTTTAINLSASLAVSGKKVLLIDLDPQGNATDGLGFSTTHLPVSVYDLFTGRKEILELVFKSTTPWLHLVPANINLVGAEVELVGAYGREFVLKTGLGKAAERYDYIIMDCPPSLGLLTLNALTAAHSVLIPMQCEYYAMRGLQHLLKTIEQVRQSLNPALQIEGILLTMFDGRNNLNRQVFDEVQGHFNDKVLESTIPRNIILAEAPSHGRPVLDYDVGSKGAQAYFALAKEVMTHAA